MRLSVISKANAVVEELSGKTVNPAPQMKAVSICEMKAHWSEIEEQVREGASFLVLKHANPQRGSCLPHHAGCWCGMTISPRR